MDGSNFKKLHDVEGKEQYRVEVQNRQAEVSQNRPIQGNTAYL
jgi:hypothetical protein